MTWDEIETSWHDLVDRIIDQWPSMSADRVMAIAGDRNSFTRYIAESHDLTIAEATEAVELWMYRILSGARRG